MSKVVVICTGQPGAGRDEYLQELRSRRDFFYYHLFEYIVEEAEKQGYTLNKLNVLDFYDSKPGILEAFRAQALKKIIAEIGKRDGVHVISTPYHFEWKGKSYEGLEDREVKALDPEIFLVVIDDLIRVRERLREDPQWKEHNFTLIELSQWRREEVMGVYNLSRRFTSNKEFYMVAKEHGLDLLQDLIFNRHKKKVYLSHPITGEASDFFKNVRRFAESLQQYYTIFDPYMIKDWDMVETWRRVRNEAMMEGKDLPEKIEVTIEYSDGPRRYEVDSWDIEAAIKNLRAQVIDTDYKTIESCHYVVAYHPREPLSAGVVSEMIQAKGMAKFVYVFYPFEPSPFFEWYSTKIFPNEDEIIKFLKGTAGKEVNSQLKKSSS
ncbi:MAG: ATP-binding protein [Candidatus Bathyarchaeota archaeon]|nr:ATP-binding protein [Candidatus Bathyarchaeota archaeon]